MVTPILTNFVIVWELLYQSNQPLKWKTRPRRSWPKKLEEISYVLDVMMVGSVGLVRVKVFDLLDVGRDVFSIC